MSCKSNGMDLVSVDMRLMTGCTPSKANEPEVWLNWPFTASMSKNMIIVLIHSHNIILNKYLHNTIQSKKEYTLNAKLCFSYFIHCFIIFTLITRFTVIHWKYKLRKKLRLLKEKSSKEWIAIKWAKVIQWFLPVLNLVWQKRFNQSSITVYSSKQSVNKTKDLPT